MNTPRDASPAPKSWQRFLQRIPASSLGAALFARTMHRIDPVWLRWTKGRHPLPTILIGVPIVTLVTTGARSGKPRRAALIGIPFAGGWLLIASNWGQPHHPGWYYNLRANPQAVVETDGEQFSCTAREITETAEYEQLWSLATTIYRGYTNYRRRTSRTIPMLLLLPIPS